MFVGDRMLVFSAQINSSTLPHTWDERGIFPVLSVFPCSNQPSLQPCTFTSDQNNKHTFVPTSTAFQTDPASESLSIHLSPTQQTPRTEFSNPWTLKPKKR